MGILQPGVDLVDQLVNGRGGYKRAGLIDFGHDMGSLVKQFDVGSDGTVRIDKMMLQPPAVQGAFQKASVVPEIEAHTDGVFSQIVQHGAYVQPFSGQIAAGRLYPVIGSHLQPLKINGFVNAGVQSYR